MKPFLIIPILILHVTSNHPPPPEMTSFSSSSSSPPLLKCTRDYHCPSKCDTCKSGYCTHEKNLNCSRDYHCPACEVCRSGKCTEGVRYLKNCLVSEQCDDGEHCVNGFCAEIVVV